MTELSERMRAWAEKHPERATELIIKADAFDVATEGFYADPQTVPTKEFVSAWISARRLYCEVSGEAII